LKEDQHDSRKSWLLWIIKSQEEMSSSNVHAKVWRHDHPIPLDSNIMFEERLSYIHLNLVRPGIYFILEDYIYSSVGAYAGEIGLVNVKLV
jgi:putative transposase